MHPISGPRALHLPLRGILRELWTDVGREAVSELPGLARPLDGCVAHAVVGSAFLSQAGAVTLLPGAPCRKTCT